MTLSEGGEQILIASELSRISRIDVAKLRIPVKIVSFQMYSFAARIYIDQFRVSQVLPTLSQCQ